MAAEWLLLLLHVSCQLVQVLSLCPAPFTMQAGVCVFVSTAQSNSWCSANQQCADIGGELINSYDSIRLLVGNNISSANCGSCQLWVGLSDLADERGRSRAGWQRVNGNGIFPEDASLFYSAEHTGSEGENCLRKNSVGKLVDKACSMEYGFVCEFIDPSTTPPQTTSLWKSVAFARNGNNSVYCFTQLTAVIQLECAAAAMTAGSSRHVLYNSKLRVCRLLLFTDSRVEQEIETNPDWSKFSLQ